MLSAGVFVALLVVTRLFGHVELKLLQKRVAALVRSWFSGPNQDNIQEQAIQLQGSLDPGDCWARLTESASELGLTGPLTAHGQVLGRVEFCGPRDGCLVTRTAVMSK